MEVARLTKSLPMSHFTYFNSLKRNHSRKERGRCCSQIQGLLLRDSSVKGLLRAQCIDLDKGSEGATSWEHLSGAQETGSGCI